MSKVGVVEGFFGPTWSHEARISYAPFLKKYGGDFYIYAPKRDPHLRKAWRQLWPGPYLDELISLRDAFQNSGLKFGVALSPFGLGRKISSEDWDHLQNKFKILAGLGLDYLGLFFDDMPSTEDLLKVQTEVVELALKYFPKGLIFCPSYYTFDPILDKVFGNRPLGYVEGLKDAIPQGVDICWTGPKVISEEIDREHLQEVERLLGRRPFIWENIYANDGPRNCKFLKLKYFTGRDSSLETDTEAVGFNLMNQPYLSQLLFVSSVKVMREGISPQHAFEKSAHELCSPELASFIIANRQAFLEEGLDKLTDTRKESLRQELGKDNTHMAREISGWLRGDYLVGPECLTD